MLVIFPVFNRIALLPYFLRYYVSMGATQFVCALHNGRENPLWDAIQAFAGKFQLEVQTSVVCGVDSYSGSAETPGLNRIRKNFAEQYGWYCIADLDEFHFFGGRTLSEIVREAEDRGFGAVHGQLVDRIAADGSLPDVQGLLDETFPLACDLSRCAGVPCRKIVLARGHVEIAPGHHLAASVRTWHNMAEVHHFKWVNGVREELAARGERYARLNLPWADECLRVLELIQNGGIDLSHPGLKMRTASMLGV